MGRIGCQRSREGCGEAGQGVSPDPFSVQRQASPPPLGERHPWTVPQICFALGNPCCHRPDAGALKRLTPAGEGQRV